ncbi:kinase-like domain-containing protein [Mycena amicta]|nr:kinase-like domain-containing protein [Mycena amicta]
MSHPTNDPHRDSDEFHIDPQVFFPDLDPGYYDEMSYRWMKPASPPEEYVYQRIQHVRILKYFGTRDGYLELEFHPNNNLWSYLVEEKPSLATRIEWAVQIAEGMAHLHSHSIVWADAHFGNILVTENVDVVLSDFAFSLASPRRFHEFTTAPPPVFLAPWGFYGKNPTYVDIFGFGVMLFALLANRFPWTEDLCPPADIQEASSVKNGKRQFDTLEFPELDAHFGSILTKCFNATYVAGAELLADLKQARAMWLQSLHPNTAAL